MIKIITLGTSHGSMTPRRAHTATLIQCGDRNYLIDAGEPTYYSLVRRGLYPEQLDAIFITHCHFDHTNSLPALLARTAHYQKRLAPEKHLQVLLPEERNIAPLLAWCDINQEHSWNGTIDIVGGRDAYDDGTLKMTAYPNCHLAHEPARSLSFLIELEGKKFFFSGDVCGDLRDFPKTEIDGVDAAFFEMTHYPFAKAVELFRKMKIKRLILQHVWEEWDTEPQRQEFMRLTSIIPYPVEIAEDGNEYLFA